MSGEATIQVLVDVSPAGFHGSGVGKNSDEGNMSSLNGAPLLQLPQHVHAGQLVAVGAPANGHAGQRREKDTLHLLEKTVFFFSLFFPLKKSAGQ